MLSGIVNVWEAVGGVAPPGAPAGFAVGQLWLVGVSGEHNIKLTQTAGVTDGFTISSPGTDLTGFSLNGATPQYTPVTVTNITADVNVNLGTVGPNTFDIEAPLAVANSVTTFPGNLLIANGSQTNTIDNAVILGNLVVTKAAGVSAYCQLVMTGTIVDGTTAIGNGVGGTGTGGDSYTQITNCQFLALAGGVPVTIVNGDGNNVTWFQGAAQGASQTNAALTTTQIGTPNFPAAAVALRVTNGAGGSNVMFTNANLPGGTVSNPVVYGSVAITDGMATGLQTNGVNFSYTTVYGAAAVNNLAGGDTEVFLQNSEIGANLSVAGGCPLAVTNTGGGGQNLFYMQGSQLPGGLWLDNTAPGSINNQTFIDSSYIGITSPTGTPANARPLTLVLPAPAAAGDAAYVSGGSVLDTVVVRNGSVVAGALDLNNLGGGSKQVALDSSTLGAFDLVTPAATGTDSLWIGGTTIQDAMNVSLGTADTVWLQKGSTNSAANSLPALPGGAFSLMAGAGPNYLYYDSADALPAADTNTPGVVQTLKAVTESVAAPWAGLVIPAYPTWPTD
jgi:hypothetical protein